MNGIGIDVGSKELVVVVSVKGKHRKAKTFKNTVIGFNLIIQLLSKLKGDAKVCLEATGVYHFDLTVALSKAKDIDVMVINPNVSNNFAKVLMKRSKTDAIDAEILAIYCEKMPFERWDRPAKSYHSVDYGRCRAERKLFDNNEYQRDCRSILHLDSC